MEQEESSLSSPHIHRSLDKEILYYHTSILFGMVFQDTLHGLRNTVYDIFVNHIL